MARTRIGGNTTASVTLAMHFFDSQTMRVRSSQVVDESCAYGDADSGTGAATVSSPSQHRGSGVISWGLGLTGWSVYDASSTSPGLRKLAPAGTGSVGTSAALLFITGCSFSCDIVVSDMEISGNRNSGVVPVSLNGMNAGVVLEAWDET